MSTIEATEEINGLWFRKNADEKKVTWRQLISEKMETVGESWDDIQSVRVNGDEEDYRSSINDYWDDNEEIKNSKERWADMEFYDGFGGSEGVPFLIWTEKYIYFPAVYDGSEWVEMLPRDPSTPFVPWHIGGE